MTSPILTTELETVNAMLATISEAPVNSLLGENNADVAFAKRTLAETLKEVLAEGWHFNTEDEFPLIKDVDGFINVPPTTISVDVDNDSTIDVVQRGTRLYDKKNHTYVFAKNLTATIVSLLPFNELPEPFRQYIGIRAARKFGDRAMGSEVIHKFTDDDEQIARVAAERFEADTGDYNILRGASALMRVPRRESW